MYVTTPNQRKMNTWRGNVLKKEDPKTKLTGKAFVTTPNWFVKPKFHFPAFNNILAVFFPYPEPPVDQWFILKHVDGD